MAKIAVARASFESGTFPPVCCATGEHTEHYASWEFTHAPAWTWMLLLFGILPFFIASAFSTVRFRGTLPMTPAARNRANRLRWLVWIFGLSAPVVLLLGLFTSTAVGVAGLALAVLWLITLLFATLTTPNARPLGDAIELTHVHPTFVETIRAAWAAQGRG